MCLVARALPDPPMACLRSPRWPVRGPRRRESSPVSGGACCGVKLAQVNPLQRGRVGERAGPLLPSEVCEPQMTGCSLCSDAAPGSAGGEPAGQATSPWSPQSSGERDAEWTSESWAKGRLTASSTKAVTGVLTGCRLGKGCGGGTHGCPHSGLGIGWGARARSLHGCSTERVSPRPLSALLLPSSPPWHLPVAAPKSPRGSCVHRDTWGLLSAVHPLLLLRPGPPQRPHVGRPRWGPPCSIGEGRGRVDGLGRG